MLSLSPMSIILLLILLFSLIITLDIIGYQKYLKRSLQSKHTKEYSYIYIDAYKLLFVLVVILASLLVGYIDAKLVLIVV